MHSTLESTARQLPAAPSTVRANQCLVAIAWMRGQAASLQDVLAEARAAGVFRHVHRSMMSDELSIRMSLDKQKILLPQQKRSRWPVQRVELSGRS